LLENRTGLVQHALGDQDGFLSLSEDALQVLLSGSEIVVGLGPCVTQGGQLFFDLVGGRILVLERRVQGSQGVANRIGGRIGSSRAAASSTTTVSAASATESTAATAAGTTTAAAATTATATESAHLGLLLQIHDFFDLGLEGCELVVSGSELGLDVVEPTLTELSGVEISPAPSAAASATTTTESTTAASAAITATATAVGLPQHGHCQCGEQNARR
jgi:hypothetical protein